MKSVSVKQLQEDLSHYLDEARAGKEVLIKERNKPVVKLVPLSTNGFPAAPRPKHITKGRAKSRLKQSTEKKGKGYMTIKEMKAHEAKLVAEGKMSLPEVEPTTEFWEEFFKETRPNIPLDEICQLINEDRDEDEG